MKFHSAMIAPLGAFVCGLGLCVALTIAVKAPIKHQSTPEIIVENTEYEMAGAVVEDPHSWGQSTDTPQDNNQPRVSAQTTDDYLCDVYRRMPSKKDAAGDFTWKDQEAAKRKGMDVCAYAIGGMSPELKVSLVSFGKEADAKGLQWSIMSGFRDDYRQSIASGIKARVGNSKHGNSRATKGYGDGRAVDIGSEGPIKPILALIDAIGRDLGLTRPHKSFDPQHVQLFGGVATVSHHKVVKTKMAKAKTTKAKTRYAKKIKHKKTRLAMRG